MHERTASTLHCACRATGKLLTVQGVLLTVFCSLEGYGLLYVKCEGCLELLGSEKGRFGFECLESAGCLISLRETLVVALKEQSLKKVIYVCLSLRRPVPG